MDEIFDVIQSVHQKSTAHSGVQKTFAIVSDETCMQKHTIANYYIRIYINRCIALHMLCCTLSDIIKL